MADLRAHINKNLANKEGFYEFLLRKRLYLPDTKCSIITVKFLDLVYRSEIYLPKVTEVRPIRIADPPIQINLPNEEVVQSTHTHVTWTWMEYQVM